MPRGYPIISQPGPIVDAKITDNVWYDYIPVVTITGAGVAPTFLTTTGRYRVYNSLVMCAVRLTGNGGTAGSGAGQLSVSLPVQVSPCAAVTFTTPVVGHILNNARYNMVHGTLAPWGLDMPLFKWDSVTAISVVSGADLNNAIREINLQIWYEACLLLP